MQFTWIENLGSIFIQKLRMQAKDFSGGIFFCGEWELFGFFHSGSSSKCEYLHCHLHFIIFENNLKISKGDFFPLLLSPPPSPILGENFGPFCCFIYFLFHKKSKLWPHLCPVSAAEHTVLLANGSINCFVLPFHLHTKSCHLPKTSCLLFITFKFLSTYYTI